MTTDNVYRFGYIVPHGFPFSHVEGAAEQLLKWTKRGPKWNLAVETCMAAMEGNVPTQEARRAFEAAAKEERMFLPPA
ncbi:DUF982 domain-containing protein [Mesorhizobium calcicola]|uniref:DUF982 domain-containing protein n=1 Tax=Mesorhizobium calcicola TaxID=1300310 RepID=A0ABW4WJS8_9HYPH